MDYEKVIEDFNNGTINRAEWSLIIDNDCGYWRYIGDNLTDDEQDELEYEMASKYGTPRGYSDVVAILNASGVNAEWV